MDGCFLILKRPGGCCLALSSRFSLLLMSSLFVFFVVCSHARVVLA